MSSAKTAINACFKSIGNLYRSLAEKYFATPTTKDRLMKPNLPLGYTSQDQFLPLREEIYSRKCMRLISPKAPGNYVKKAKKFMVADDLTVTNHFVTAGFSYLSRLNIPLSDVYELEVKIGLEEALSILKASLTSTCVLTHGLRLNDKSNKQHIK